MRRSDRFIIVVILISPFVFLSGCLEFASIDQPSSILPGEIFTVFIEATVEFDDDGNNAPYFGICLPNGWTIPGDAVACTGIYNEEIIYDPNLTLGQEDLSPAPEGYYWWVGDGNEVLSPVHGTVYGKIQIQTDEQTSLFSIDYMLSTSSLYEGLYAQRRSDNHLIEVVDEYTPREPQAVVEGDRVSVNWIAPITDEGLKGYNIYRDGQLINTNLLIDTEFSDEIASDGVYFYEISSVYNNSNEHFTPYKMRVIVFLGFPRGTGEPHDPFQVSTPVQLVSIANDPNLLDKSFILVNDIDLDPNLPAGEVFENAVIPEFSGKFDGNDYKILNLTITGNDELGLFSQLSSGAEVKNLGVTDVKIFGVGDYVGGLAGLNLGYVIACYNTGEIRGTRDVGGLVGYNSGNLTSCYTTGMFVGNGSVGGLVGYNEGIITASYSTGKVSGGGRIGGLVGENERNIIACYSSSTVSGSGRVGGLVGYNEGIITASYSTGTVSGGGTVGGLVGENERDIIACYSSSTVSGSGINVGGLVGSGIVSHVTACFWDTYTSGRTTSAGGRGLTTADMQDINTYLNAGWDFVDEILNGTCDYWQLSPGDYPRLHYHIGISPTMPEGLGTAEQPYLVRDARDLGTVWFEPSAHYRLEASVDLSEITYSMAVIPWFEGTFDGNGYVISNLHVQGSGYLGLFGQLGSGAEIYNLGLEAVDVNGIGRYVGGLVGSNYGDLTSCYITGTVSGDGVVGGLVGSNYEGIITASYSAGEVTGSGSVGGLLGTNYGGGTIANSYSTGTISGDDSVGGLVGTNSGSCNITTSYSTGTVSGDDRVGGLVGSNGGNITTSYSTGGVSGTGWGVGGLVGSNSGGITASRSTATVSGPTSVGGLVGYNYEGTIATSYSTGTVSGNHAIGGLVGANDGSIVTGFWDTETSGLLGSDGGIGLTTAEMMDPKIIGLNGLANDPNWILDPGKDYPRLTWEGTAGELIPQPQVNWMDGDGTQEMPYQITNVDQLIRLSKAGALADKDFILINDLDLEGLSWFQAVIPCFTGSFNGNRFCIRHVSIQGRNNLGLIGILRGGIVTNLGLENISIEGTGSYVGGLVGSNDDGSIANCYSTGTVSGYWYVGGLVGTNVGGVTASHSTAIVSGYGCVGGLAGNIGGTITASYSTGTVSGTNRYVGGLVGSSDGSITASYSTGTVSGTNRYVGGLVGSSDGSITTSYSTGTVTGNENFGGLVGINSGSIISSFWDIETSGQATSADGMGLTTIEMQDINTYLNAGWDFVDEILNGNCDYWQLSPGDYPRLRYHFGYSPVMPEGLGTAQEPYQIRDARDLGTVWFEPSAHYRLEASVNLSGLTYSMAVIPWFKGTFDGNGYAISNLHIQGSGSLGLFGQLGSGAEIYNLGLEAVDVNGTGNHIGSLAGENNGNITASYSTGTVSGYEDVGGLVGRNFNSITMSHNSSMVTGDSDVGGFIGENRGNLTTSFNSGTISGDFSIGGLVGQSIGSISTSYSTGTVSGDRDVGGLVGTNGVQFWDLAGNRAGGIDGIISSCYSVGSVTGGGLVGSNERGQIDSSFWDIETSGQISSAGGMGLANTEMQTASTFVEAGWDFVDEVDNGTEDIWWIDEGQDYPRLWWELIHEN